MNTKDVILIGAGLVVGYLLVGYLKKQKDNAQVLTDSLEPNVDQAKTQSCNEKVLLLMQASKFSNKEAEEAFKKQAFEECMAKSV
jgi:F0F1-type ATP synthase epsilon subunit